MQTAKTKRNVALRLFGFTFCTTSSYIVCRIVADTVLLSRIGVVALAPMLILAAVVVGVLSYVWARQTRDLPLRLLVVSTQLASVVVTAVLALLLTVSPNSMVVIGCVYVMAELRGCLNVIQLTVMLNETFCSRSEQQKFAFVNAGAPVAGIVAGSFLGIEAEFVSPAFLLACTCLADICGILIIRSTIGGVRITDSVRKLPTHTEPTVVLAAPTQHSRNVSHARTFASAILWMVVCKTIVLTIVSFEWKVFASEAYHADERSLAAYFGIFYAVSDGLILFTQLFLTRFVLKYLGVAFSILLLPLYLTILGIISLRTQNIGLLFFVLTAARGAIVIRRGIHQVAVQILYGTMPTIVRRGIVSRILGIAKPVSEASTAAGIGLLVLYLPVRTLAWIWMPVLAIWLWWTIQVAREWTRLNRDNTFLCQQK